MTFQNLGEVAANHGAVMAASLVSALLLGIIRRADVPDSQYHAEDSAYPAVFPFPAKGECAGTLIDTLHAVTAAHCLVEDGEPLDTPFSVTFGNGASATVTEFYINPCYDDSAVAGLIRLRVVLFTLLVLFFAPTTAACGLFFGPTTACCDEERSAV